MTTSTAISAEQFLLLPDVPCRRDLMKGEVWTMAAAASPDRFWEVAPDVVVKVDSPGDSQHEVAATVAAYLRHGVRLVWVARPKRRAVVVHAPGVAPRTLDAEGTSDGGDMLPGFAYPLARLWAGLPC